MKLLLRLSRPHFWVYELGTLYLGVLIAASAGAILWSPLVLVFAFFFLFPANLLIYGINDIFDYETDIRNPKKVSYEGVLDKSLHKRVFYSVAITSMPFLVSAFWLPIEAMVSLLAFFGFAIFYSAPPIRAKARPVFDSFFSAGHYVATGVFGFYLVGGTQIDVALVVAAMAWAIAMHAYSAVPDIQADKDASLETIATKLGAKATILVCFFLYGCAAFVLASYVGSLIAGVLFLPFAVMMLLSLFDDEASLLKRYTYFSKLNTIIGMILFFLILFEKGWL